MRTIVLAALLTLLSACDGTEAGPPDEAPASPPSGPSEPGADAPPTEAPEPAIVNDERFHEALRAAVVEYASRYGNVDDALRWAPAGKRW